MTNKVTDILIATSTIADGNMGFRFGGRGAVVENRKRFLKKNGIAYADHICMACSNGDTITPIDWSNTGRGAWGQEEMLEAEVLVSKEKGLALMLLTADCIPGVFHDPVRGVVALAHLNRHTIAHDLAEKTVHFLTEQYGSRPEDLRVHFGPHIKKGSYAFALPLETEPPKQLRSFTEEQNGNIYIDMTAAYIAQLRTCGVSEEQIRISPNDTATSNEHFSHYRAKHDAACPEGRMATIAMLLP